MPRKVCWADFFGSLFMALRSTVLQQKHSTRRLSTGPAVYIGWCLALINHNYLTVSRSSHIKTTHQFSIFSRSAHAAYIRKYREFLFTELVGVERQVLLLLYTRIWLDICVYITCVLCLTSYVTKVSGVLWEICVAMEVCTNHRIIMKRGSSVMSSLHTNVLQSPGL